MGGSSMSTFKAISSKPRTHTAMTPEQFEKMRQHCINLIADSRAGMSVPALGLAWAKQVVAANPRPNVKLNETSKERQQF
jgi:hypothetical protein